MGLGLEDFLNLTPFEFNEAHKAFIEKLNADREWQYNAMMQVARWQVFKTLCPPQQKQISILDLIELPGDEVYKKAAEEKQTNREKFEKAKERMGKW